MGRRDTGGKCAGPGRTRCELSCCAGLGEPNHKRMCAFSATPMPLVGKGGGGSRHPQQYGSGNDETGPSSHCEAPFNGCDEYALIELSGRGWRFDIYSSTASSEGASPLGPLFTKCCVQKAARLCDLPLSPQRRGQLTELPGLSERHREAPCRFAAAPLSREGSCRRSKGKSSRYDQSANRVQPCPPLRLSFPPDQS